MFRRVAPLFFVSFTTFFLFLIFQTTDLKASLRHVPQAVGLGEQYPTEEEIAAGEHKTQSGTADADPSPSYANPNALYAAGTPKAPGESYTRTLVIPRTKDENVDWIDIELGDMLHPNGPLQTAVYVVNDKKAALHPPKNKGHEVMVYLSYIIDHYDDLPDVAMFMHSHRYAWHNNELMDADAVQIIRRLSVERVIRQGYMNLRCHWDPGCPNWLHPGAIERDYAKQEEHLIAESWSELFPLDPIPPVLSQPCCAQFALSRERIQAIPLARYVYYRDWLLRTPLSDYLSGRIWEYVWQYVFTGNNVECPAMHICYCDGFGICFGGADEYNQYFDIQYQMRGYENELWEWRRKEMAIEDAKEMGSFDESSTLEVPELGRDEWLNAQIQQLRGELYRRKELAYERGSSPRVRAEEAGRDWKEGDGY